MDIENSRRHARFPVTLTIVVPCYNEERTLEQCIDRVRAIASSKLALEIIIVDDYSTDNSLQIAMQLKQRYPEVVVLSQPRNLGKGAALRVGFQRATGDFVAVQDADLEYDPMDLRRLLEPLIQGQADVVMGSRFLASGVRRVLYYWHSVGNKFLTFISNMFTDLNLTDMETCYKVFRREVIQRIRIEENRFGFEPEIVAKVAHLRLRIFEVGISYYGRTYAEGKKIGAKDGLRALYCILRYNLHRAPVPVQFMFYILIGAASALVNLVVFLSVLGAGYSVSLAAPVAFGVAAAANYAMSVLLLFRHRAHWNGVIEVAMYIAVVAAVGTLDLWITSDLILDGISPAWAKLWATALGLLFNFAGRRFMVFPEPSSGPWKPQGKMNTTQGGTASATGEEGTVKHANVSVG